MARDSQLLSGVYIGLSSEVHYSNGCEAAKIAGRSGGGLVGTDYWWMQVDQCGNRYFR